MAQNFYHMSDVQDLKVVSDEDGEYMLRVILHDGAEPREPTGLINSFVSRSSTGHGFPISFGRNHTFMMLVDSTLSQLEDVVSFYKDVHHKPR